MLKPGLWAIVPAVLFATAPLRGQPAPLAPDFQISTSGIDVYSAASVAMNDFGEFVVVWSGGDDGSDRGIFGRRYDSAGQPLGGEFSINTYTTGAQSMPEVAMDDSGRFVAVWNGLGPDGHESEVLGQLFAADGSPEGVELHVNTFTTSQQWLPRVAMKGDGVFVVVWHSEMQGEAYGRNIFGQRFATNGSPLGGEFQVNTFTTNSQLYPDVTMDSDGNFVVVWFGFLQDGSAEGIFRQGFDAAGAPLGGEFQVNTYTTDTQERARIAGNAAGESQVVWESFGQDGFLTGIFGQRADADGSSLGGEFQVNVYTSGGQVEPDVAMNGAGDVLISWTSSSDQLDVGYGLFGRHYDGTGAAQGGEFVVSAFTTGGQGAASVATDGHARFVITWIDHQGSSISGRLFEVPCEPEPDPVSGLRVALSPDGSHLLLGWDAATNASEYVVFEDEAAGGSFEARAHDVGTCGDGFCWPDVGEDCSTCPADCNGVQEGPPSEMFCCGDGLTGGQNPVSCDAPRCSDETVTCVEQPAGRGTVLATPSGDRNYLVAGRNQPCGTGAKKLASI